MKIPLLFLIILYLIIQLIKYIRILNIKQPPWVEQ